MFFFRKESPSEDFEIENGVLKKYIGAGGNVVIPKDVVVIDDEAFKCCETIESVKIPRGVTTIGRSAFAGCRALKSITIPDTVTRIESFAFSDCTKLIDISMPRDAQMGNHVFIGCAGLMNGNGLVVVNGVLYWERSAAYDIVIPEGVEEIGAGALGHKYRLRSVRIPEGVRVIGPRAFAACPNLTEVNIPLSLEKIGPMAFERCPKLQMLTLPEGADSAYFERLWNDTHTSERKILFALSLLSQRMDLVRSSALWKKNIKLYKNKIIAVLVSNNSLELLSRFFSLYKAVSAETIDVLLEDKNLSFEMRAYLMNYKNKHYTTEELERLEEKRVEAELNSIIPDEE